MNPCSTSPEGFSAGSPRWLHVDINAYFATLLQQENPGLRGKPIGVLKSAGRSCVITSSKEAKALGVKTGCSKAEALELAPDMIFVPAHFAMCMDATKRLNTIFRDTAPNVEIFSLDESFLDLTDCWQIYPSAFAVAQRLQDRIRQDLGEWVTCNVAIARNRFLAKMASELAPKGSITIVKPEMIDDLLLRAPFSDVCGIGHRLELRLRRLGVTNTYMINLVSDEDLEREFGPFWSKELRTMARGEEPSLLQRSGRPPQQMKSVGRSITGYRLSNDENNIRRVLYNLTAEVMHKARRMHLCGRRVSVYVSDKHGKSWGAHKTLQSPIRRTDEMFDWIYHGLYRSWKREFPIIKYGVTMSLLQPWESVTEPLWEDWQRQEMVAGAVDQLTQKFGLYSVRSGVMTDRESLIRPEVTGWLGDKVYQMGFT